MRISINEDVGKRNLALFENEHGRSPKVYLEGVEIKDAVAADSWEGWVERYLRGRNGSFVVNRIDQCVVTETLRGRVSIE